MAVIIRRCGVSKSAQGQRVKYKSIDFFFLIHFSIKHNTDDVLLFILKIPFEFSSFPEWLHLNLFSLQSSAHILPQSNFIK